MDQQTLPAVPRGFRLAGVHCGVKRNPAKEDLTLIVTDAPVTAAGVYTQNRVFGAPVGWDRARTPSTAIRAVVINSGVANACTGERGDRDAAEMARLAGETAGADAQAVLVMSTGVIGEHLPMDKIAAGIALAAERLGDDATALRGAARGMMTTDSIPKLAGKRLTIDGREVRVCGLAKGAAMIGPNMATMLSVLLTDAAIGPATAQALLRDCVDASFNCISVEGHMSTSDTVLLLASGDSPAETEVPSPLREALAEAAIDLARQIVADGEGTDHLITIDVSGCATRADAHRIAKTVAESALVKTAIAGADPNWGRIVSAAGYAGVDFDPRGIGLTLNAVPLYRDGERVAFDAAVVSTSLKENRDTHIELTFTEGDAGVRFWTTDLTAEYVRLNADYHT